MNIIEILNSESGFIIGCLGFIIISYFISRIGSNTKQLPDKPDELKGKNK